MDESQEFFPLKHPRLTAALELLDLSKRGFTEFPETYLPAERREALTRLQLHGNNIGFIPGSIGLFSSLVVLDVSNNNLSFISEEIVKLKDSLQTFVAKNNCLDDNSLPKTFSQLHSLQAVNIGGNQFTDFPPQLTSLSNLVELHLGSNKIRAVPETIKNFLRLEVLNMGDNLLDSIPSEVGQLTNLNILNLASNRLQSLPKTLIRLRNLRSLSLHNNRLATLPPEIVSIDLEELSLRNNPLVVRFIQSMTFEVPSLMEIAGRIIKLAQVSYSKRDIPASLDQYLNSANKCVNPKCKGVFFSAKVEHVKFVDFCGKYKLPLLQYLCSPSCSEKRPVLEGSSDSESDEELAEARRRIKRVLLG